MQLSFYDSTFVENLIYGCKIGKAVKLFVDESIA